MPDRRAFILDPSRVAYVFDVCKDEDHVDESDVTEHAVEVGVNITDHVRRKTTEINLNIVQSNYPIYDGKLAYDEVMAFGLGATRPPTGGSADFPFTPQGPVDGVLPAILTAMRPRSVFDRALNSPARAERFYAALKILKESAALLRVYTSLIQDVATLKAPKSSTFAFLERYYVIRRLSASRDNKSQAIVSLSVSLKELNFVNTKVVANTVVETQKLENQGTKEARKATPVEDTISRNPLGQWANTGLLGGTPQDPMSVVGENP